METHRVPFYYGYELYALEIFQNILDTIVTEVEFIAKRDPDGFYQHNKYKFLEAILENITQNIPANPDHPDFRQGLTLGKKNKSWRRVKKKNLPPRYRLFFQFSSKVPKTIIYAWVNDDSTLGKAGSKTDVYSVFGKMLARGDVPNTWQDLYRQANPLKA